MAGMVGQHQRNRHYHENTFQHEIGKYIILNAASFIDEYEIHFVQQRHLKRSKPIEPEYTQRIKNLDEIIKPILNTLNRWSGIKQYRNNFVAHSNRSGQNQQTLVIPFQESHDAPRQFWEFQLLRDLIHIMFGVISQEFKMELVDAWVSGNTLKPTMNPCKDNSDIQAELENMVNEFNNISQRQGKVYSLNIPEIEYEPLKKLVDPLTPFSHLVALLTTGKKPE